MSSLVVVEAPSAIDSGADLSEDKGPVNEAPAIHDNLYLLFLVEIEVTGYENES